MRLVRVAPLLAALACASAPRPVTLPLPGPAPAEPAACTAWTEAQEQQCLAEAPNAFGATDGTLGGFGGGVGGRRNAANRQKAERHRREQTCTAVREEAGRQCARAGATAGGAEAHAAAEATRSGPASAEAQSASERVDAQRAAAGAEAHGAGDVAPHAAGRTPAAVPTADTRGEPEACPAGGFQRACWGMTEAQVRARVKAAAVLPGDGATLRERQDIAGLALAVLYHLERDGLGEVELLPWTAPATTTAAADGFRTLRHLLEARYGTPVALAPEDNSAAEDVTLRWSTPGTCITLWFRPAAADRPLRLHYAREAPAADTTDADRL